MVKETPTQKATRLEPLSVLWRTLSAPQTLLVCLGLLALALALGALIPQIPPQARNDPQAWLAVQSGPFAPSISLIRTLHLYDLYHTLGFRLVVALTGLVLFVRAADAAELAGRATRRAPWPPDAFSFWGASAEQACAASPLTPEAVLPRIHEFLAQRGFRRANVSDLPLPNLVAVHRPGALWVEPLVSVALLLALLGLAIGGAWGWQAADWLLAPGELRAVGRETGYSLRLDAFEPKDGAASGLCSYHSQITWLEGDTPLRQALVGAGQPATLRGLAARQISIVPRVTLRGRDEAGDPLLLLPAGEDLAPASQVEVRFPSPDDQPLVLLPGHDLFLTLAFVPADRAADRAADREGRPALDVTLVRNGGADAEALGRLYEGGTLAFNGFQIEIAWVYQPVLRVDHRPAMSLVVAGLALALVALVVSWLLPGRLLWIAVGESREEATLILLLTPRGPGKTAWLPQMAARLGEALADGD